MNVELLNTSLNALNNVSKMLFSKEIKLQKKFMRDSIFTAKGVASIIGFTGTVKGQAIFVSESEVALNLAKKMMNGFEFNEVDEMVKSAFGEFCNMIMGNSAQEYSQDNKFMDITPPTLLFGEKIEISTKIDKPICFIIEIEDIGQIELNISCT